MRSIKVTIMAVVMVLTSLCASAQTFSEWFAQKKTQKRYLLEQIAALQVYIGYAKKGYQIAGDGLGMVRNITSGEFKLHDLFITGLKKVSPAIRSDVRIAEIMLLEVEILKAFGSLMEAGFSDGRLDYLLSVKAEVTAECLSDLEELLLVVTSGKSAMTDDQRLARLDAIYSRMRDKAAFTQGFSSQALLLLRQLDKEQKSVNELRRYYEIN